MPSRWRGRARRRSGWRWPTSRPSRSRPSPVLPSPILPATVLPATVLPGTVLPSQRATVTSDRQAAPVVDLNADLGESFGAWKLGDDEALMRLITSANVACGFHAGGPLP